MNAHELLHDTCEALVEAKGPQRHLDRMLADCVLAEMPWATKDQRNRIRRMAFTRGVEQADRFFNLALPGWDWSVGSDRKKGEYHVILWRPDHSDFQAEGPTPALAMLIGAINAAIYQDGFEPRQPPPKRTVFPWERPSPSPLAAEGVSEGADA